jgi:hypothetical protein
MASNHSEKEDDYITKNFEFSKPKIDYSTDYAKIYIDESNTVILNPNKPILPAYKKTIIYPYGTIINNVDLKITSEIKKEIIIKNIQNSPNVKPPEKLNHMIGSSKENLNYNLFNFYPEGWFEYKISSGLYSGEKSIILNLIIYPIRNNEDIIYYFTSCEINIEIEKIEIVSSYDDEIDLLIIGPEEFSNNIQPFVEHKESLELETRLVTLESIYNSTYFPVNGRDDAEKVKYFLKNAYDNWNISYVLLVGGRKPGIFENWYTPVRYVNVFWADENRYMSELYYADIYDGNYNFSTWDTDNNNIFSEWPNNGFLQDEIDLYPEIYIGRWPCRNSFELDIIIQKTIEYENMQLNKKIVLVGGDNFEDSGIEGEIVCDKSLEYLAEFDYGKVYASEMEVSPENMRNALGNGAIFMHMHGHGSPVKWGTHYPDAFDEWMDGLYITDVPWFFNEEYPILILGGCHTAMFNVSLFNRPWIYGYRLTPEGLGWWFARKIGGGGIATFGYTCFPVASPGEYGDLDSDGINEPDCVESGYGYIQLKILKGYGIENKQTLGECWEYAVNQYLNTYKIPSMRWHLHTSQGFVLLGDPSLKIGGY